MSKNEVKMLRVCGFRLVFGKSPKNLSRSYLTFLVLLLISYQIC